MAEGWASLDLHATWMRGVPSMHTEQTETPTRTVPGASAAVPGGLAFLGVQAAAGYTVDDRIVLPLIGASVAGALGGYRPVHTSLDGSIARLDPWTSTLASLLLPGLGLRGKERRWQWQLLARPAVSWLAMRGNVAAAGESVELVAARGLFSVRAEGEVCRRLAPDARLCVFLGPTIWERGFLSGGQGGLRWETGP